MEKITNEKEYYVALATTKELEDEARKLFAALEQFGYYLDSISEFDIASARELARQGLNKIEKNYSAIYGINSDDSLNAPKTEEDRNTHLRQLEIRSRFAKR